jgi:hypothetical protein
MTGFESKRAMAQDKLTDDQLPDLVDLVMEQIRIDIETGDLTALEELLGHVPKDLLEGFLSENTVIDINNTGGKW